MRRTGITLCLLTGVASAAAVAPPAASAADSPTPSTRAIQLSGGQPASRQICGATQDVLLAQLGATTRATLPAPKTRKGRRGRKGTRVVVDKCANGAFNQVARASLGARRKVKRVEVPTAKAATGDYRVRMIKRNGRPHGQPTYVRVGVGEMVDTPVTFTVVNKNDTLIPCPTQPDNGTYQVKGTLVAPRSVLIGGGSTGKGPDLAFYYHGLGYGDFFWRYKGAPGYDYGLEQAYAGHASVTVDRLGYGESRGPASGNQICYSSHVDIANQLIGKIRSGDYTTGEGGGTKAARVAFVGHSAGGLLGVSMQGEFGSADALGLVGYNSTAFSPLAGATLVQSTLQCGSGGIAGPNGTRNYGRFGDTDAQFKEAHIHNMEPGIEADLLRRRSADPCGDILSITGSFLANQGFSRNHQVPVLFVSGSNDALFPPIGTQAQDLPFFSGLPAGKLTTRVLNGTGHAVTLGRTHEDFRSVMDNWLETYGF